MNDFCGRFPPVVSVACKAYVDKYGQAIINLLG